MIHEGTSLLMIVKSTWTIVVAVLVCLILSAGCTDPMYGLADYQKTNLRRWQAEGQEIVVEKKPQTATVLGFILGFGAFYTHEPVLGIIDLLLWPVSAVWEPWIAPAYANKINYEATKEARARGRK